jgi:hypothetical protein
MTANPTNSTIALFDFGESRQLLAGVVNGVAGRIRIDQFRTGRGTDRECSC